MGLVIARRLRDRALLLAIAACMCAQSGCAWLWQGERERRAALERDIAHARAEAELHVAVARVGTKVCREMQVGVASREIIRGTIVAVEAAQVRVRIDEPGVLDHTIGGTLLRKGSIVADEVKRWRPCV